MPTRKDLHDSELAQFTLGLLDNNYYCNDHSPESVNERNYKPLENSITKFTGEKIGTIRYDPETKEMIFEADSLEKD
jgi:hypothetical protein